MFEKMLDKNGKIIRAGDIVRIDGAYFKTDNALYFVQYEPGGADWSGAEYSLIKIGKTGKISTAKYRNAFFPLVTFTNSREKRLEANAWNAEHVTIEVIEGINNSEVKAFFEQQIEDAEKRKKRYYPYYENYAEQIEREENFIKYYNEVLAHISGEDTANTENLTGKSTDTIEESEQTENETENEQTTTDINVSENQDEQAELCISDEITTLQLVNNEQERAENKLESAGNKPEADNISEKSSAFYFHINEDAARRAQEMSSFSDYKPGSATAEYRAMVDEAAERVENHKKRVDKMYHDKIDSMFEKYRRKLAENLNDGYRIDASYPSVMIAGPSGFNCRKKEKQNARRDANMQEYLNLKDYLGKILSVGNGGIMSDDKKALEKLRLKVEKLEEKQAFMKSVNAALRLKDTAKGDEKLKELGCSDDTIGKLRTPDMFGIVGYASYELSLSNQNIHRLKDRIQQLEREQERAEKGEAQDIKGDGFVLTENPGEMRIQFLFDEKPDEKTRTLLKSNGFKWAPSQGAWQRLLNNNGRYAAKKVMQALSAE